MPIASNDPVIATVAGRGTRVALADDNVLLREALEGLLERSGFEVAGPCGTASALIALRGVRGLANDATRVPDARVAGE